MAEPILTHYQAFVDASAKVQAAQVEADAKFQTLLTHMPEGELYSTQPNPPPLVKRVGGQVVQVTIPYLGDEVQS